MAKLRDKGHSTPESKNAAARGRGFFTAVQVLRTLLEHRSSEGVTQIAASTGLAKSSAHNILEGLTGMGFVEKDPSTLRYSLSPEFFVFLRPFATDFGPNIWAGAFLQAKSAELGVSLWIGTLARGENYIISAVGVIGGSFSLGAHSPAYASSTGKVLVSQMPKKRWPDYAPVADSPRLTPNTNMSPEHFYLELEAARKTGVAVNVRESDNSLCSVSACIPEPGCRPRFAVAIVFSNVVNIASAVEVHSKNVIKIAHDLGQVLYPLTNGAPAG